MLPSFVDSTNIPILQEVINFAQSRHAVLAGNIANVDTPEYRVRDLSVETFQMELGQAIEARRQRHEQITPGVIADANDDAMHKVRDSMKHILYHDGSDVSMEQQVTEMAKNQFMHNLAIAIMSSQFRLLQVAVSERV